MKESNFYVLCKESCRMKSFILGSFLQFIGALPCDSIGGVHTESPTIGVLSVGAARSIQSDSEASCSCSHDEPFNHPHPPNKYFVRSSMEARESSSLFEQTWKSFLFAHFDSSPFVLAPVSISPALNTRPSLTVTGAAPPPLSP